MFIRVMSASVAAMLAAGLFAAEAQADHRKKFRKHPNYDYYYAGPEVVREIPGIRLFFGDYALTREEFDALYGDEPDYFDEGYYEPQPITPPKPRKKKAAATQKAPPSDAMTTASVTKAAKPDSPAKATTPATGKTATAATSRTLSCDKAESIVSGYGFSSVKPANCKGETYAFNATRDGKSFTIKLDSASGELTEVKKLK